MSRNKYNNYAERDIPRQTLHEWKKKISNSNAVEQLDFEESDSVEVIE